MAESEKLEEQRHLDKVCAYINGLLSGMDKNILDLKSYIKEERARIWDDYMHSAPEVEDAQGVQQIVETEIRDVMRYERMTELNRSLILLADNPYFARIDVKDEFGTDSIYIGKRALMDADGYDMLVCDWRSDIASLFYDADLGKASYMTENGKVDCSLLLRRQFNIEDGKIKYMLDSDIAIEDDILESELAKTGDAKLKTILATIQREQSVIIRDISADLVLVEGVAGSGKTSIALHRLAYLLYRFRKVLTAGEIVIFSVNNIFSSYIVDVLPDLGEDRAVQTGFYDWFKPDFENYTVEDSITQAERAFSHPDSVNAILAKGGEAFRRVLEQTFIDRAREYIRYKDISFFGSPLRSADEIRYLYETEYASYLPDNRRRKIRDGIVNMVQENPAYYEKRRREYEQELTEGGVIQYTDEEMEIAVKEQWTKDIEALGKEIDDCLTVDCFALYSVALKALDKSVCASTEKDLQNKRLRYEDFAALVYLKTLAGQIAPVLRIKHLLLDEAQEYSPVMFSVFGRVFPNAKYTVVGDCRQSFLPFFEKLEEAAQYFPNAKTAKTFMLDKSYRSTAEINEYLEKEFAMSSSYFNRHGEPVDVRDKKELRAFLSSLPTEGRSIAVITKTAAEAKELQNRLRKAGVKLYLMTNRDVLMPNKTVIIPSFLTKGLEFDEVVVADASRENWTTPSERHSLYVSESRALHKLTVFQ